MPNDHHVTVYEKRLVEARRLALRAKYDLDFKMVPGRSSEQTRPDLRVYRVTVEGVGVGRVEQTFETVGRKVGRILFGQKRVRRWSYSVRVPAERGYIHYFASRKAATETMIERILAAGMVFKDGQLVAGSQKGKRGR